VKPETFWSREPCPYVYLWRLQESPASIFKLSSPDFINLLPFVFIHLPSLLSGRALASLHNSPGH
jgi:hypothetical protein